MIGVRDVVNVHRLSHAFIVSSDENLTWFACAS